ncbi:hypothetical protein [Roseobacter weihaiensis]|uniref:hypothetical protein n=1 Tax=Roseobacter weihaiensis TaxID=2763262 RepID=UPI001D0B65B6|nr:hypothetical protein [Roseobacter sp. H9]
MKFGKKIKAKPRETKIEEHRILGPTWSIEKTDEGYVYEYLSGELAGGIKRHPVTREDFEAVKKGRLSDYDLLLKYNLS